MKKIGEFSMESTMFDAFFNDPNSPYYKPSIGYGEG